jgi:hypothetical protein
MSVKQNDLPNEERPEENLPESWDIIAPQACCGTVGMRRRQVGQVRYGTTSGTGPATPDVPLPADGRITIDPVTRIEGHLRLEAEIKNGQVASAWSSGMLFRGIETILKGRNPEDA